MAKSIAIFGTSSDAGKSTIALLIGKILQELGYSVAPFKAQNVSNNARVADDGSEIAYSQYFQALALGVETSWHNNPVLLKSGYKNSTSLVVKGKALGSKDVRGYYRDLDRLKPAIKDALHHLQNEYEIIIAEGAGSPVELNLMEKDLSNIFTARATNAKIILVADIEKGGVFASIYGVYNLLPKDLRDKVAGVIINKFRGDKTLFDDGIKIIEKEFGIPVFGVLPKLDWNLGFEDSLNLANYRSSPKKKGSKRVAIISYPTMSNYNDFEPLIVDDEVELEFVRGDISLESFDLVILPGSKLVMRDLQWLKSSGLFERLKRREGKILGICGGYEMMFEKILDPFEVESNLKEIKGLGFIDDVIFLNHEKVVKKDRYHIFGRFVDGFEIHNGISQKYPLLFEDKNIQGTFVHALFEDEKFKSYQKIEIEKFVFRLKESLDIKKIRQNLEI
jgi:adenosylcobyric acid synthase